MTTWPRKKVRRGPDKSGLAFPVRPAPTRREVNAPRNQAMGSDRRTVLERAHGRCEFLCVLAGEPTEVHHVLGGADRRTLESEFSEAGICEDCHGRCNDSPAWARRKGMAWAERMAANELFGAALALEAERTAEAEQHLVRARAFLATAELLEGRMALAAAQARPLPTPADRSTT